MMEYMQTDLRDGRQVLMDGANLARLLEASEFTDVTNREINVPVGTWDPGISSISYEITLDQNEIGAVCSDVWTAAMHAFGAQIVPNHFKEREAGEAFLDQIGKELHDPQYELYCYLYASFRRTLTSRYVSYARKP